jgi:predicted GIY-YIG superfamily endonuclease
MTTALLDVLEADPTAPIPLSFQTGTGLAGAFIEAATAATELPRLGLVYLLHFDRPYGHAGHYCGFTTDLDTRLAEHAAGRGARLLAVAKAAGITWQLARTWPGTRTRERALKRQGGAARRCPLCSVTPRATTP